MNTNLEISDAELEELANEEIHIWIKLNEIKNEKGEPIDFRHHLFLFDIYEDQSQYLVVIKAAQIGMSTAEIIKNLYDAHKYKMDIIYTLPTDADVVIFVGGKVNRIIAQNPVLLDYTKDKDSIEVKQVGESVIYFRGTFTKKAAIMVTADRLVHDEKDSSKQDVIGEYQARLQHSKFKQIHTFSHPSAPGTGVDVEWQQSDQKEWFITCSHCSKQQYMEWSLTDPKHMNIDLERQVYICKYCKEELTSEDRRVGKWKARIFRDAEGNIIKKKWSGYHVSLLMASWVTAEEIIAKYNDPETTEEFFYNKILGLPYVGTGNKLTEDMLMSNLTDENLYPNQKERMILGVDTGLRIDYVMGSEKGLFFHGDTEDYDMLDKHMKDYPRAIAIVDAGGDLIGSRKFQNRWKGRVFLCYFQAQETSEAPEWGTKEKSGLVFAPRNKMIQLVVDEFRDGRMPLQGSRDDWYDYWLDWNNLTRQKIVDATTGQFKTYKWIRSGRDHRALATTYFRIGLFRFSSGGTIIQSNKELKPNSYAIEPGNQVSVDLSKLTPMGYVPDEEGEWR